MFSRFAARTQDMAFAPYKDQFARRAAASYAAETLAAYLQGRERAYAVQDVLNEFQALFGLGAKLPVELIRQGLALPHEDDRVASYFAKAMHMIEKQVRGGGVTD
jgi:hypothetical protein